MNTTTEILAFFSELPDADTELFTEATKLHHIFLDHLPDASVELSPPSSLDRRFQLFSRLPIEVRLIIWEYGCWVPHEIKIFRYFVKELELPDWRDGPLERVLTFLGLKTVQPNPGILTANRESREVAMKIYTPLLGTAICQTFVRYFNPVIDTVIINFGGDMDVGYDLVAKIASFAWLRFRDYDFCVRGGAMRPGLFLFGRWNATVLASGLEPL